MKDEYETIQDIYMELDDIEGRFIMTNGKIDYEASYNMVKKDVYNLKAQILKENPEFQR